MTSSDESDYKGMNKDTGEDNLENEMSCKEDEKLEEENDKKRDIFIQSGPLAKHSANIRLMSANDNNSSSVSRTAPNTRISVATEMSKTSVTVEASKISITIEASKTSVAVTMPIVSKGMEAPKISVMMETSTVSVSMDPPKIPHAGEASKFSSAISAPNISVVVEEPNTSLQASEMVDAGQSSSPYVETTTSKITSVLVKALPVLDAVESAVAMADATTGSSPMGVIPRPVNAERDAYYAPTSNLPSPATQYAVSVLIHLIFRLVCYLFNMLRGFLETPLEESD